MKLISMAMHRDPSSLGIDDDHFAASAQAQFAELAARDLAVERATPDDAYPTRGLFDGRVYFDQPHKADELVNGRLNWGRTHAGGGSGGCGC